MNGECNVTGASISNEYKRNHPLVLSNTTIGGNPPKWEWNNVGNHQKASTFNGCIEICDSDPRCGVATYGNEYCQKYNITALGKRGTTKSMGTSTYIKTY